MGQSIEVRYSDGIQPEDVRRKKEANMKDMGLLMPELFVLATELETNQLDGVVEVASEYLQQSHWMRPLENTLSEVFWGAFIAFSCLEETGQLLARSRSGEEVSFSEWAALDERLMRVERGYEIVADRLCQKFPHGLINDYMER